jgi:hypothetical protein
MPHAALQQLTGSEPTRPLKRRLGGALWRFVASRWCVEALMPIIHSPQHKTATESSMTNTTHTNTTNTTNTRVSSAVTTATYTAVSTRLYSLALAALMTLGTLGAIEGIAGHEAGSAGKAATVELAARGAAPRA